MTVTAATSRPTSTSAGGTRPKRRKLDHSKVRSDTTNITPISAASGICSISAEPNSTKASKKPPVARPERRCSAPLPTLIMLCPIIAQPPMPPKKPVTTLAAPCAAHSRVGWPTVSVMSSIRFSVSSDSIRPMAARISA